MGRRPRPGDLIAVPIDHVTCLFGAHRLFSTLQDAQRPHTSQRVRRVLKDLALPNLRARGRAVLERRINVLLSGIGGDQVFLAGIHPCYLADLFRHFRWLELMREAARWQSALTQPISGILLENCFKPLLRPNAMFLLARPSEGFLPWINAAFWRKYNFPDRMLHRRGFLPRRFRSPAQQRQYLSIARTSSMLVQGYMLKAPIEVRNSRWRFPCSRNYGRRKPDPSCAGACAAFFPRSFAFANLRLGLANRCCRKWPANDLLWTNGWLLHALRAYGYVEPTSSVRSSIAPWPAVLEMGSCLMPPYLLNYGCGAVSLGRKVATLCLFERFIRACPLHGAWTVVPVTII